MFGTVNEKMITFVGLHTEEKVDDNVHLMYVIFEGVCHTPSLKRCMSYTFFEKVYNIRFFKGVCHTQGV